MSEEIENPEPVFEPVTLANGDVWTGTDGDVYLVTKSDGRVVGYRANGELSAENVEADIASPKPVPVGPKQLSKLELKARLDVLGKWSAFVAFLKKIGAWDDFILASFIATDHLLFTTYAPQVKKGISLTEEQFDSLIL
jgi:hypothetical protein